MKDRKTYILLPLPFAMQLTKCDAKGRLYLRESIRERYGRQFIVVPAPGELLLIPVPDDPVADLRDLGKKLRGFSLTKLKTLIKEEARRQVSM